jgi:hypothetical protein
MNIFFEANAFLKNNTIISKNNTMLSLTRLDSKLSLYKLSLQIDFNSTWNCSYDGFNDIIIKINSPIRTIVSTVFMDVFKIERDLALKGTIKVSTDEGVILKNNSWIKPKIIIIISNFQIIYEGSIDIIPPLDSFVILIDKEEKEYSYNSIDRLFKVETIITTNKDNYILNMTIFQKPINLTSLSHFSMSLLIDDNAPIVRNYYPDSRVWLSCQTVTCAIEVNDYQSGINIHECRYRINLNNTSDINLKWIICDDANIKQTIYGIFIEILETFEEGKNIIEWNITDNVGNYILSNQSVQIDLLNIVFEEFSPSNWINSRNISYSVVILDMGGSEINGSSIQYSSSSSNILSFSEWYDLGTYPDDTKLVIINTYRGIEGKNNYIRFRGKDNAAKEYAISQIYPIWIDTEPPIIIINMPINNSIISPNQRNIEITLYDNSSGIKEIITHLYDSINNTEINTNITYIRMNMTEIQARIIWYNPVYNIVFKLECRDFVNNKGISNPLFIRIDRPPIINITNPKNGSKYFMKDDINFTVITVDEDNDQLSIIWTLDNDTIISHESSFHLNTIPIGIHSIKVIVKDNYYTIEDTIVIKIVERDNNDRVEKMNLLPLITLIFCLIIILILYIIIRRRHRKQ